MFSCVLGGGQCISSLGGAFQRDQIRTIPFGLLVRPKKRSGYNVIVDGHCEAVSIIFGKIFCSFSTVLFYSADYQQKN